MSSLWKNSNKLLLTIQQRPSPTYCNHISHFAQSKIALFGSFMEEISLFNSFRRKIAGSMTVEAAIVLPLFFFFCFNLTSAIEMIRLHGNLEMALWQVGNRVAVYGHILDNEDGKQSISTSSASGNQSDSWWMELLGVTLSYTYVKSQIVEYLGENYLEQAPLTYGTEGLQFLESNLWESDGKFEIVLTYGVSPPGNIMGFPSFRMANRYYGHMWSGYEILKVDAAEGRQQYVYITETGEVYHNNPNCTHLKLSVQQVSLAWAHIGKNEWGERYDACEKCSKWKSGGSVYITGQGDCYHFDRQCPGLKRTIQCVPISQVSQRRLCSRCGKKE